MCSQHFSHLNLLKPLLAMHGKDVNVSPVLTAKIQVPSQHPTPYITLFVCECVFYFF